MSISDTESAIGRDLGSLGARFDLLVDALGIDRALISGSAGYEPDDAEDPSAAQGHAPGGRPVRPRSGAAGAGPPAEDDPPPSPGRDEEAGRARDSPMPPGKQPEPAGDRDGSAPPEAAPQALTSRDLAAALLDIADLSPDAAWDVSELILCGACPEAALPGGAGRDGISWDESGLHVPAGPAGTGRGSSLSWEQAARWASAGTTSGDLAIIYRVRPLLKNSAAWAVSKDADGHQAAFRGFADEAARIIRDRVRHIAEAAAREYGADSPVPADLPVRKPPPHQGKDDLAGDHAEIMAAAEKLSRSSSRLIKQIRKPGPLDSTDLAIALRGLDCRAFAAVLDGGVPSADGSATTTVRGPGETDAGATQRIRFTRAQAEISVVAPAGRRSGSVPWKRVTKWLARAVTPQQAHALREAARLRSDYDRAVRDAGAGADQRGDLEAGLAQLTGVTDDLIRQVTDAADKAHGPGKLLAGGNRQARPQAGSAGTLPGRASRYGSLASIEAQLARLAAGLPEKHRSMTQSEQDDESLFALQPEPGPGAPAKTVSVTRRTSGPGPGKNGAAPGSQAGNAAPEVAPPPGSASSGAVPAEDPPAAAEPGAPGKRTQQPMNGPGAPQQTPQRKPGNGPGHQVSAADIAAFLGGLSMTEFVRLVEAEGGDPGLGEHRFAQSVSAGKDGVRAFDVAVTRAGLDMEVSSGDGTRSGFVTWEQAGAVLASGLTPALRGVAEDAHAIRRRCETSANPEATEIAEEAAALIARVQAAVYPIAAGEPGYAGDESARLQDELAGLVSRMWPGTADPYGLEVEDPPPGWEDEPAPDGTISGTPGETGGTTTGPAAADEHSATQADESRGDTTMAQQSGDSTISEDPPKAGNAGAGAEQAPSGQPTPAGQDEGPGGVPSQEQTSARGNGDSRELALDGMPDDGTGNDEPADAPGEDPGPVDDGHEEPAAIYDFVITRPATADHDGDVSTYRTAVERGALQVRPGDYVEDAAVLYLTAYAARTGQASPEADIRVYAEGQGDSARTVSVTFGDSGVPRNRWTEPEPLFTATVAQAVAAVSAAVSVPAQARQTPGEPADTPAAAENAAEPPGPEADPASPQQPGSAPDTAAPDEPDDAEAGSEQQSGPEFDSQAGTLTVNGVTVLGDSGPGSFTAGELRSVPAAAADAPPAPLPAAADIAGPGSGSPVPVYSLPGNAIAGTGLRPNRIAFASGTAVEFRRLAEARPASTAAGAVPGLPEAERVSGTSAGVVRGADGSWLQAVDTGEGVEAVPLAAVFPAGADPYEGLSRAGWFRAVRFDVAEAAGLAGAVLRADEVQAGDVIVPGDPADGAWVVAGVRPGWDGGLDLAVQPAEGSSAKRLPDLGKRFRVPGGSTGFTVADDSPLFVRHPVRHPVMDAPGGPKLFADWAGPRRADEAGRSRDPLAGLALTPELREEMSGLAGQAETLPEFLDAMNAWLDRLGRDQGPSSAPQGPERPSPAVVDPWRAWGAEFGRMRQAADAAAKQSPELGRSGTWRQLRTVLGKASDRARSAGNEGKRPSSGIAAMLRRVCSGICQAAGAIAFAAARKLPAGKARDTAERLGNRASGFIARERGWLQKDERLEPGSYSLPDGWKGSPARRADVAAQLHEASKETGADVRLGDLVSPGAAGFTRAASRRSRVPDWRVRAAARGPARTGSSGRSA